MLNGQPRTVSIVSITPCFPTLNPNSRPYHESLQPQPDATGDSTRNVGDERPATSTRESDEYTFFNPEIWEPARCIHISSAINWMRNIRCQLRVKDIRIVGNLGVVMSGSRVKS